MNIGMVTDTYRPRVNGVVTSTDTFASEFEKLGHKVFVMAPAFPKALPEPNVLRFPSHYLFFDPEDRVPNPWLPAGRRLVKTLPDLKLDIIHTQTPFTLGIAALKWGRTLGIPVVHTYHTLFTAYAEHYLRFIPRKLGIKWAKDLSRGYCNRCRMILTPSSQMKEALLSYGVTSPVEVNPTGIKIDKFAHCDGPAFRQKYGVKPGEKMLLFMGRVAREKNIDFLFRVLKRLLADDANYRLVVAGEGPAKAELIALHKEMGLEKNVLFLGYFSPGDWVNCYAAADLFTFASVTETQGLVVTEAMAVGTPVVAVGAMGVLDVMRGEKGGSLVKLEEEEFTTAVKKYMKDRPFYEAKRKEAFLYAKEWSSEAMAKRLLANYRKAMEISG